MGGGAGSVGVAGGGVGETGGVMCVGVGGGVCAMSGLAGMAGGAAAGANAAVGDKGGVCSTSSRSSGLLAKACSG